MPAFLAPSGDPISLPDILQCGDDPLGSCVLRQIIRTLTTLLQNRGYWVTYHYLLDALDITVMGQVCNVNIAKMVFYEDHIVVTEYLGDMAGNIEEDVIPLADPRYIIKALERFGNSYSLPIEIELEREFYEKQFGG